MAKVIEYEYDIKVIERDNDGYVTKSEFIGSIAKLEIAEMFKATLSKQDEYAGKEIVIVKMPRR